MAMCHYCGREAAKRRCKLGCSTFYCSASHEDADAKDHNSYCNPMLVDISETKKGQVFMAKQDVEVGTIIMSEYPFLLAPTDQYSNDKLLLLCLSCGKIIARGKSAKRNQDWCSGCRWPVCSSSCEKMKIHKWNECKYFKQMRINFEAVSKIDHPYMLYRAILCLRYWLLKQRDPESLKIFMNVKVRKNPDDTDITHKQDRIILRILIKAFHAKDLLPFDEDEAEMEISSVLDRIAAHGFMDVADTKYQNRKSTIMCAYNYASAMKRSCVPNVIWCVGSAPVYSLKLIAAKHLKEGEEILLPVKNGFHLLGTKERQRYMMNYFNVTCTCIRCKDPTELNSFISGVKCTSCENGYLVFTIGRAGHPTSTLKCSNVSCARKVQDKDLPCDLQVLDAHVRGLITKHASIDVLAQQLEQLRNEGFLHPNHYLIVALVSEMMKQKVPILHTFSANQAIHFVSECEYLCKIYDLVAYEFSFEKAALFYFMGRAFYRLYVVTTGYGMSVRESYHTLENIMDLYKQASDIFQTQNLSSRVNQVPENSLCTVWTQIRSDMKVIIAEMKKVKK